MNGIQIVKLFSSQVSECTDCECSVPNKVDKKIPGHVPTKPPTRKIQSPTKLLEPLKKTTLKKKPDIKIATKTITLSSTTTNQQIIEDIQQSKSSREPSSENIWPYPVSNDYETGNPRYPNLVTEPDDDIKKSNVTHTPIHEDEDDYSCVITEITTESLPVTVQITDVDKIQEADECLLSVTDKVTKFINTAENLVKTKKEMATAPKVPRPELVIDNENLVEDDCLLSVSDKVNKFLSSAEDTVRPKSPRCRNFTEKKSESSRSVKSNYEATINLLNEERDAYDQVETVTTVTTQKVIPKDSEKVTEVKETITPEKSIPNKHPETPKSSQTPSNNAVRKAKALFENKTSPEESPRRGKPVSKTIVETTVIETKTVTQPEVETILKNTKEFPQSILKKTDSVVDKYKKLISNEVEPKSRKMSSELFEKSNLKANSPKQPEEPAKSSRKMSSELFEKCNIKSRQPLTEETPKSSSKMSGDIFEKCTVKSKQPLTEEPKSSRKISSELFEKCNVKSSASKPPMKQEPTRRGSSPSKSTKKVEQSISVEEEPFIKKEIHELGNESICTTKATKFGVVLRRTDSSNSNTVSTERRRSSVERRRSSVTDPNHQLCIEDIEDLCLLEQMVSEYYYQTGLPAGRPSCFF